MDALNKIDIESKIRNYEYSKISNLTNLKKKQNWTKEEKKQIEKTARDFEAMFVYLIFKGMRKAMLEEFSENGESTKFGDDILNDITLLEVTNQIAKNGFGIGIANKIYEELTGEKILNLEKILAPEKIDAKEKGNPKQDTQKVNSEQVVNPKNSSMLDRISKYENIIQDTAKRYNLSPQLIKSVIAVESGGNHRAVSSAGAKGLMQLIDSTANYVGVCNVFDPVENIEGGAKYLREMLDRFDGNLELALAAYNAGPGNVIKYNGIPPFRETKNYIAKVKRYLFLFNNNSGAI